MTKRKANISMHPPKLNFTAIQPKVPLFRGSGTGRDTYVMHDSGGFVKASCADALIRSGGYKRATSSSGTRKVGIQGKALFYHSNGTGRDSYIVTDSGGLTGRIDGTSQKAGFINGLRGYARIKTAVNVFGTRDYFEWAQTARTGREAEEEINKSKTVRDLTERLAHPKTGFRLKDTTTRDQTLQAIKEKLVLSAREKARTIHQERVPCKLQELLYSKEKVNQVKGVPIPQLKLNLKEEHPGLKHRKIRSAAFIRTPRGENFTVATEGDVLKSDRPLV